MDIYRTIVSMRGGLLSKASTYFVAPQEQA